MEKGLTTEEARLKLKEVGLNQLPSKRGKSVLRLFFAQFQNIFSLILFIAVVLSYFVGDGIDAALIFVILFLNASLGFWQEFKASKELEALKKLEVASSRVIRDGVEVRIPAYEIVPGDLVVIESGDKIPADGILVLSYDLSVNESSLTGESQPVIKSTNKEDAEVYFGTTVASGRGKIIILQIGSDTKFGKIALNLAEVTEEKTPLEISLDSLARKLGFIAIFISLGVFILRSFQGFPVLESLFAAIALMVAAVPEGLPAVITVLLAIGVRNMYKKKTLVRRMSAVESLGATSVIATDKTGTLTKNEMNVKEVMVDKKDVDRMLRAAVICNSASLVLKEDHGSYDILGDTTEGALLLWAHKNNIDIDALKSEGKIIEEIPFDLKRRMMSVLWEDGGTFVYCKGAPEVILSLCNLSEPQVEKITEDYKKMATQGLRVLAFAFKDLTKSKVTDKTQLEKNLTFLGLTGIADIARPEAAVAIKKAREAGIDVVMITGDNELTAKAIAAEVGLLIEGDEIITGAQLKTLSDAQLKERISGIRVFARVVPEDKLRIVQIFQSIGKVVAVTGDGVNDSLALKQSHVGVAMGKVGTDVAKEASDIVILDDNFATIIDAVEQGRSIYLNILKTVKFLVTGNLSEILLIVGTALAGFPTPLLPVQLLWINFVTDGLPALSLAADSPSSNVMKIPPRGANSPILDDQTLRFVLIYGVGIAAICIGVFAFSLNSIGIKDARAYTFTTMVLLQMVLIFVMRRHHTITSNKYLLVSVGLVLIMQALIMTVPELRELFKL